MTDLRLSLIRHGETDGSVSGQHTGRTDLPLTEKGERQALQLRATLRQTKFDRVYTSALGRARRTCDLAGLAGIAQVEPSLREWDYGEYEGKTTLQIRETRPEWNLFRDGCPQGESADEVGRRADRLLSRLRAEQGAIALFSHAHFLRVLAVRWIGLPVEEGQHFALNTGSLSGLGYEHPDRDIPCIFLWNAG
ncbi:MAG: histidine phosphatase family protein [Opitutaceae bacterium]